MRVQILALKESSVAEQHEKKYIMPALHVYSSFFLLWIKFSRINHVQREKFLWALCQKLNNAIAATCVLEIHCAQQNAVFTKTRYSSPLPFLTLQSSLSGLRNENSPVETKSELLWRCTATPLGLQEAGDVGQWQKKMEKRKRLYSNLTFWKREIMQGLYS